VARCRVIGRQSSITRHDICARGPIEVITRAGSIGLERVRLRAWCTIPAAGELEGGASLYRGRRRPLSTRKQLLRTIHRGAEFRSRRGGRMSAARTITLASFRRPRHGSIKIRNTVGAAAARSPILAAGPQRRPIDSANSRQAMSVEIAAGRAVAMSISWPERPGQSLAERERSCAAVP